MKLFRKIIKFQLVAWLGSVVNLTVLWLLKEKAGFSVALAGALAIELAIIHNFTWHYFVTWKEEVTTGFARYFAYLLRYNAVTASIDFVVNWGTLWVLATFAGVHYLIAGALGMVAGPFFKFLANEYFIFRKGEVHGGGEGEG